MTMYEGDLWIRRCNSEKRLLAYHQLEWNQTRTPMQQHRFLPFAWTAQQGVHGGVRGVTTTGPAVRF